MLNISSIKNEIISDTFIEEVIYFDNVSSTNSYAKKTSGRDNILFVAGFQSKGRGRFTRQWESEPNKNLLFSIKKVIKVEPTELFSVNFFYTYYLLDSITQFLQLKGYKFDPESFFIKWPNDLIYENKKFCGILIENNLNKNEFIIGTGINVNQTEFNSDYNYFTTSLKKITGVEIDLNDFLKFILRHISNNYSLFAKDTHDIYNAWKKKCNMIGKKIRFNNLQSKEFEAQVVDINKDGSICLKVEGEIKNFFSGEIKNLTN